MLYFIIFYFISSSQETKIETNMCVNHLEEQVKKSVELIEFLILEGSTKENFFYNETCYNDPKFFLQDIIKNNKQEEIFKAFQKLLIAKHKFVNLAFWKSLNHEIENKFEITEESKICENSELFFAIFISFICVLKNLELQNDFNEIIIEIIKNILPKLFIDIKTATKVVNDVTILRCLSEKLQGDFNEAIKKMIINSCNNIENLCKNFVLNKKNCQNSDQLIQEQNSLKIQICAKFAADLIDENKALEYMQQIGCSNEECILMLINIKKMPQKEKDKLKFTMQLLDKSDKIEVCSERKFLLSKIKDRHK